MPFNLSKNPYIVLLIPAAFWLFVFFLVPLGFMLVYSFLSRTPEGGVAWALTFGNYARTPEYVWILFRSLTIAFLTTLICLVVGYPFAYGLAQCSPRWRSTLLLLVVIPFWTNFLIRTYAWRFILWQNGVLDTFGKAIGIPSLAFHGTQAAVMLGLVYGYLPFMILPLYVTLERLDKTLLQAAQDLGATPAVAFRRVTLPLSLPGIVAGSILVFIPAASAFVTPKLLGGAKTLMLGELVDLQFKTVRDWPFGSAVGFILMLVVLSLSVVYFRMVKAEEF